MKTAIYKITNRVNNKFYIGISSNPTKRWWEHRRQNKKTHTKLYNAFKKHGIEVFNFEILSWCDSRESARDLENLVIDVSEAITKGYNMCPGGGGGIAGPDNPSYGKPLSPEVRAKMSDAAKKRGISDKTRISSLKALREKEKDPEWLSNRNAKISVANKGRIVTEEWRAKLCAAHVNRAPPSLETRAKISASLSATKAKSARSVLCIETGKTYASVRLAAMECGVSKALVSMYCNDKMRGGKSKKGLSFRYVQ